MSFSTEQASGGVIVKDEGLSIATPAGSIDFVGTGVTATAVGPAVTATIPGGGAAVTEVRNEVPTDNGDGTYTIAHTPVAGTVIVSKNGGRLKPNAGNDYTFSGTTITSLIAYNVNDQFLVDYQY